MGSLTQDMGRLRDEIARERIARHTLINDNRQDVTDAAHAFMRDLRVSVETMRVDRMAFLARLSCDVADIRVDASRRQAKRKQEVAHLLDDFQRARGVMATEVRAADQAFVSDIVRTAHQLVGEFAGQRSAARQAWYGQAAAPTALSPQPPARADPEDEGFGPNQAPGAGQGSRQIDTEGPVGGDGRRRRRRHPGGGNLSNSVLD